jgi:L-ribulose-5-phosphate 3-epimerase
VNIPGYIAKLKEIGYKGPLTIEREIGGAEQMADIRKAIEWLKELRSK